MNTFLWILQSLLAAFFILPGIIKLVAPRKNLVRKKAIQEGASAVKIRLLGILEVMGVAGIILPSLLHIIPVLTSLAALGFAGVMAGAFIVHFRKKEYKTLPLLVLVFILSITVAILRF